MKNSYIFTIKNIRQIYIYFFFQNNFQNKKKFYCQKKNFIYIYFFCRNKKILNNQKFLN